MLDCVKMFTFSRVAPAPVHAAPGHRDGTFSVSATIDLGKVTWK